MITLTFLKYKDRAISRLETLNEIDLKTFNILKYMIQIFCDNEPLSLDKLLIRFNK